MLIDEDCFEVRPHVYADQSLILYFLIIIYLKIIVYYMLGIKNIRSPIVSKLLRK